jgi:hypothetical protein
METTVTENLLNELIYDFLEDQEDYLGLSVEDKKETFQLYKIILTTVHDTIREPDTEGIIFAKDSKSKIVIQEAVRNLREIVPEVDRISVSIVN